MTENVILLSEKSSGSSIFQREISKHSKIRTVEWAPHSEAETLFWVKAANIMGYPKDAFWRSRPPFPARYSRRSIERILKNNTETILDNDDDWEFLKSGWEQLIDSFGPVFFEKSPHHLNQWPALSCINRFIAETKKDVKFIGLVRNPMSVIYSTQQRWMSGVYERQFMWEQSYRNLLAMQQLHPDRMVILRYEDLIHAPIDEFSRILSFIGLDYEDQIGGDLHANSIEKWTVDEAFSFTMAPSVLLLGKHFGYSEEEMTCERAVVKKRNPMFSIPRKVMFRLRSTYKFYRKHVF